MNYGHRFPTFLRVGGPVRATEHLFGTSIAVFFDDSVDLRPFYYEYSSTG